jgi:DNA-binding CsgD family transcriptional regulator
MSTTSTRAAEWIGFVGDLLRQPLTEMPHVAIVDQLRDTFEVTAASYNWAEADGRQGIVIHPADTLEPLAEEFLAWQRGEILGRHPLITWHLTVGDPRPSTNDRVPRAVVSTRERQPLIHLVRTIGCEQQLAINFRLSRCVYHCYVLARSGSDFTDEDLAVAGQIQRVVIGLDRQVGLFRQLNGIDQIVDVGLTPRELSVLALLAEGLTTQAISRRLACSPRTVYKHLERAYRKLGVRDRVNALRIAQQWNLTPPPARCSESPNGRVPADS